MALDLQRLIDNVLSMAKAQQSQNVIESDKDREARLEAIRLQKAGDVDVQNLRNTGEATKQSLANTGNLAVQGLRNTGDLEQTKEINVGALARQSLMGETATGVAKINAGASGYAADAVFKGTQEHANALRDVANINLGAANKDPVSNLIDTAVKSDPYIATDPKRWAALVQNAQALRVREPSASPEKFVTTPTPASVPAPIIPSTPARERFIASNMTAIPSSIMPEFEQVPASRSLIEPYSFEKEYRKKRLEDYQKSLVPGRRTGSRSTL